MQYLLTKDELDALVPKTDLEKSKKAIVLLRQLIVPKGKCVNDQGGPEYCDFCPVSSIGRGDKGFSYEDSRLMCDLPRNYSK